MVICIGDFVILNDADRPCAKLICRVTNIKYVKGSFFKIYSQYISSDLAAHYGKKFNFCTVVKDFLSCSAPKKVSDFGVSVEINGDMARVTKVSDSVATYKNGRRRDWQGSKDESIQLRRDFEWNEDA